MEGVEDARLEAKTRLRPLLSLLSDTGALSRNVRGGTERILLSVFFTGSTIHLESNARHMRTVRTHQSRWRLRLLRVRTQEDASGSRWMAFRRRRTRLDMGIS